jgi:sodium/bile acid cotransporter 7
MALPRSLSMYRPDNFTLAIVAAVGFTSLLPVRGAAADAVHVVTIAAIALLFFLHGAPLSSESVLSGALHWRLHLLVLCSTFVLFPLFGIALRHGRCHVRDFRLSTA